MIKLSNEIGHYLLNQNISITSEYLLSVLNAVVDVKSRKKTDSSEWFLYLKIFQEVTWLLCFLTIYLFAFHLCHQIPQYIAWQPDLQSGDWCNDTKLEYRFSICISPFQYNFKSAPKNKAGMCSCPGSDCFSLEYKTIVPWTLKPLHQKTMAATTGKINSDWT